MLGALSQCLVGLLGNPGLIFKDINQVIDMTVSLSRSSQESAINVSTRV